MALGSGQGGLGQWEGLGSWAGMGTAGEARLLGPTDKILSFLDGGASVGRGWAGVTGDWGGMVMLTECVLWIRN